MSKVRGGQVFVEIGADPRKFFAALGSINRQFGKFGASLSSVGAKFAAAGLGAAAPFLAAARAGARFQDVMLNLQASSNSTAAEMQRISRAAMDVSAGLGVGPTEVAGGFMELIKAGVDLETVLGGAGQAAVQFAKVAQLDGATAATVLSKAMNAFGTDAATSGNAMSAAADASATSIEEMAQAFSQASAVASTSNQTISDLSAALAILANKGIVGSDAGTSIKTMLQKLKVPTNDAAKALGKVGLSFESFRGADGQILPLVDIIRVLNNALASVGQATRDDVLGNVFGSDAIRAATILTQVGEQGFAAMVQSMGGALSVGDKFAVMMGGLSGKASTFMAAMERLGIAVSEAITPAINAVMPPLTGFVSGLADLVTANKDAVGAFGGSALAVAGFGTALVGLGTAIQLTSFGLGGIGKLAGVAFSPLGVAVGGVALALGAAYASGVKVSDVGNAIKRSFGGLSGSVGGFVDTAVAGFSQVGADAAVVFGDLFSTATTTFSGISDALATGDLAGAGDVLMLGLSASFQRGIQALMSYVDPFVTDLQNAFTLIYTSSANTMDGMWTWIATAFTTGFAVVQGVMDNAVNGLMNAWDGLVANIRKGWLYVQSFFDSGINLDREFAAIDNEAAAKRVKREKERPGIAGRMEQASQTNAILEQDLRSRTDQRNAAQNQTFAERDQANRDRAMVRAANLASTEGMLTAKTQQMATRAAAGLMPAVAKAQDAADIRELVSQLNDLRSRGASGDILDKIESAIDDRLLEIDKQRASGDQTSEKMRRLGETAAASTASTAEVAGSFSSVNLGGMSFGSSLGERQLDETKETNRILRERLETSAVAE